MVACETSRVEPPVATCAATRVSSSSRVSGRRVWRKNAVTRSKPPRASSLPAAVSGSQVETAPAANSGRTPRASAAGRARSVAVGDRAGAVGGRCRQVDAGDVPAVLGQPDGVGALSAADVEDAAGGHIADSGHKSLIRVARPYGVLGL